MGWRLWNWWSRPPRPRRGILIFTERGQSNARWHVLTLAYGPFEPRCSLVWPRGVDPSTGRRLLQAAPGDPVPAALRLSSSSGRCSDAYNGARHCQPVPGWGQRHVSSECDLVTREARERLPVRGLTIALGSRHLFRLSVKAQMSVLARSVITLFTSLPSLLASPCLSLFLPHLFPRTQEANAWSGTRGSASSAWLPGCLVSLTAQKGPAAMPTSLAGIHLLCGRGGASTYTIVPVPDGRPVPSSSPLPFPAFCAVE